MLYCIHFNKKNTQKLLNKQLICFTIILWIPKDRCNGACSLVAKCSSLLCVIIFENWKQLHVFCESFLSQCGICPHGWIMAKQCNRKGNREGERERAPCERARGAHVWETALNHENIFTDVCVCDELTSMSSHGMGTGSLSLIRLLSVFPAMSISMESTETVSVAGTARATPSRTSFRAWKKRCLL